MFQFRDNLEGKVGIGKIPDNLESIISDIAKEYYTIIPDKNASTFHTWFADMPQEIKKKVKMIQQNQFFKELCDGSPKCTIINASEMDELYYSNPKNNLSKINLYGSSGNYDVHKDCFYNFNGIKFYRVLIGLTDGNENIITHFTNLNVEHKINNGDYVVFDFDKTTHQVIKEKEELTPRILLKIHYIVCENCEYSKNHVNFIKNMYVYYEIITRYMMHSGTDPETFYQFFMGLLCQFFIAKNTNYLILLLTLLIILFLKFFCKINIIFKNIRKITKYVLLSLLFFYLLLVLCYWLRYKLLGIR